MSEETYEGIIDSPVGKLIYISPVPVEQRLLEDGVFNDLDKVAGRILERLPEGQESYDIYCADLKAVIRIDMSESKHYGVGYTIQFMAETVYDEDLEIDVPKALELASGIRGFVKWDGCSEWVLQGDLTGGIHFGTIEALWQRAVITPLCFILTSKLCPVWDAE